MWMKNIKKNVLKIFKKNKWFMVVSIIILLFYGVIGWNWSLHKASESRKDDAINTFALSARMEEEADCDDNVTGKEPYVSIKEGKAYWDNPSGEHLFGPCRKIYQEDIHSYDHEKFFRYVDENGLIGYGKLDGMDIQVIHDAVFTEASEMKEGSACVKEGDEYYYIDKTGERFTFEKYLSAYPFAESQGSYARVEKPDGTWAVINRSEEEVLSGFESIYELPYFTTIGYGVINGKTVFFDSMNDFQTVWELEESLEIEQLYGTDYAVTVSKADGTKGVVSVWNGEKLTHSGYEEITFGYVCIGEDEGNAVSIQCKKKNGTYDVLYEHVSGGGI